MADLFPGYVIDTNALIDLWRRRYPRDVFPTLWQRIEGSIKSGELVAPQEVLNELQKQHDELYLWAKKQKCFKDLDRDQIECVKRILKAFPSLIDEKKTVPDADPFVIALALEKGWKVVSSENPGGASARKRIPDVCAHHRVACLTLLEFFRDQHWNF
jgi:hypothetical protein